MASFCTQLLVTSTLFLLTTSSQHIDGSIETNCSPEQTECLITCSGEEACGSSSGADYGVGAPLHCPTTSDCDYCGLYCSGTFACQSATLFSYNCAFVNVTFGSTGDGIGRKISIYAPGNLGSLLVDMPATLPYLSTETIKEAIIYDSDQLGGTNEIVVNCRSSDSDECDSLTIYASNSNYLELNCLESAKCTGTVYCPTDSYLDQDWNVSSNGTWGIPCNFTCHVSEECSVEAHIQGSFWETEVELKCAAEECYLNVICNDESESCVMTDSDNCDGGCQTPPTIQQTSAPSVGSSTELSAAPTGSPSTAPSEQPGTDPTGCPSAEPSTAPSAAPTTEPAAVSVGEPTNIGPTPSETTRAPSKPNSRPTVMTPKPSMNEITSQPTESDHVCWFDVYKRGAKPCGDCPSGYWKYHDDYDCVPCSVFGRGCGGCRDEQGCAWCKFGYEVYFDRDCSIWACRGLRF